MAFKPGDLVRLFAPGGALPVIVNIQPFFVREVLLTGEDEDEPGVAIGTLKIDNDDCIVVLHRSRVLITYPHRWQPF